MLTRSKFGAGKTNDDIFFALAAFFTLSRAGAERPDTDIAGIDFVRIANAAIDYQPRPPVGGSHLGQIPAQQRATRRRTTVDDQYGAISGTGECFFYE